MSEAELLSCVLRAADLLGWLAFHPRPSRTAHGWRTAGQGNGAAGFVDLVLAKAGRPPLFRELKSEKGKLRPEQERWIEALAGADVGVWTPEDWRDGTILTELKQHE